MDSNGLFEKLWQFSALMVSKGIRIIEASGDDKFLDGNIQRAEYDKEKMILIATQKGKPQYTTLKELRNAVMHNKFYCCIVDMRFAMLKVLMREKAGI